MKRAKVRAKKAAGNGAGRVSSKPADLATVREEIKNLIGNAASEMVENGIAEANKGHYAAMKFLFELAGLYPVPEGAEPEEQEGGLAKIFFNRLGMTEEEPAEEVTNVSTPEAPAVADAVK